MTRPRHLRAAAARALLAAVMAATTLVVAGGRAEATESFCNTADIHGVPDTDAPIPAELYPSTIDVTGLEGQITDVDVTIEGLATQHSAQQHYPEDLDLLVSSPDGLSAVLLSDVFGDGDTPLGELIWRNITISDEAALEMPLDHRPPRGDMTYRPTDDDVDLHDGLPTDIWPAPAPPVGPASLGVFDTGSPNGAWHLWVVDDTRGGLVDIEDGWCLTITTSGMFSAAPPADFDGDGDTDPSVFRPSSGRWYVDGRDVQSFGARGDVPVAADYDGDGVTDVAVFRPSNGRWYVDGMEPTSFGRAGDVPVPGHWDGDEEIDIAVYRPSSGAWYVHGAAAGATRFGVPGDVPVPGQWDADPLTDIAVFRPSNGRWYVDGSDVQTFGTRGDVPVPGQWDADPMTDIAVYRPATGTWLFEGSAALAFGRPGDVPVPGQWDSDPLIDVAVFRPANGRWYVEGTPGWVTFGVAGDVPVPMRPTA